MAFAGAGHAAEEPAYQLIRKLDGVELRRYAPYTVAEVVVAGPARDAGGKAFPILSDYIFGRNRDERKFAMTAPVTQTATGTTLETAELAPQSGSAAPGFLVQFALPKGITVATAPEPLDPRIRVREVSPGHVAVIRYSGFWSEANYTDHLARLRESLQAAGMTSTGEPIYARYNAPFTPWFMRRNEIWLRVVGDRGGSAAPLPAFAGESHGGVLQLRTDVRGEHCGFPLKCRDLFAVRLGIALHLHVSGGWQDGQHAAGTSDPVQHRPASGAALPRRSPARPS